MTGARIGPNPLTIISKEKNLVNSEPLYRSRTAAREITTPTDPASPWINRSIISSPMEGVNAHSKEETAYTSMPISSGVRRPYTSLKGPAAS
ncbi:hypothetical protein D3C81_1940170 [compost metagenome]